MTERDYYARASPKPSGSASKPFREPIERFETTLATNQSVCSREIGETFVLHL